MMINDDVWCFLPKGLQQYLQDRGFGGQYKKAVLGELTMSYNPEGDITPFEDYEWGYSAVLKNGNDWIAVVKKWSKEYYDDHDAMSPERNLDSSKKFFAMAYNLFLKELKKWNLTALPKALKLADFEFDYQGDWSEDDPDMESYWLNKNIFWRFEINPLYIE